MQDRLPFIKMQGIGNDFVIVDDLVGSGLDWSALSPELCDRHTGIGADGLLVLDTTQFADVMMRMYNPDGTPDVCGNGLRCLARYVIDRKLFPGDTLRVATLAGVRNAKAIFYNGDFNGISVEMGEPRFDPPSVPIMLGTSEVIDYPLDLGNGSGNSILVTALSTGSTHAVTFVKELPDDDRFFSISPIVEKHHLFPERTSLMWCVVEDRTTVKLRVWERGVGETLGCGTGACAAAVAAIKHDYVDAGADISVTSKGGSLKISWSPGEQIMMTGPAEYVFDGVHHLSGRPKS